MRSLAHVAAPVISPLGWGLARARDRPWALLSSLAAAAALAGVATLHGVPVTPWIFGALLGALYVADVARAREIVRDVVLLGWTPPKRARCLTSRAESLIALAAAFGAVRAGDAIGAEVALAHVKRTELGAWELRVFAAVRALASVEIADDARAAALSPLALPIGDLVVDRALALVAAKMAWGDAPRLFALANGIGRAGEHLADVAALCALRRAELDGRLDALPHGCPSDVAARARDVGDERFADLLASRAARRGVYR